MANEYTCRDSHHDAERAWNSEEYEAGYVARFQDVSECMTATACWRAGWQEADREIAGTALTEGMHSNPGASVPWSFFGTGQQARACDLPFDEFSPDIWKRSWVEADIALSLAERKRCA